jgi:hypothetical protein
MLPFISEKVALWCAAERERFEERAAIMEYCGGMSRERAEIEAFKLCAPADAVAELAKAAPRKQAALFADVETVEIEWA